MPPRPARTAPAEQPHQDGFGLIVERVPGGDPGRTDFGGRFAQEFVAHPAPGFFDIESVLPGVGLDVALFQIKGKPQLRCHLMDKPGVPGRSSPQAVIEMSDRQTNGKIRPQVV